MDAYNLAIMATPKSEQIVGPVGQRVASNLRALRYPEPVRELCQRLTELGRPIHPTAVTKIEKATRRVDCDDLVGLALALGVTPNRLLLDAEADDEALELTEEVVVSRRAAWRWARGAVGLPETRDGVPFIDFDFDQVNRPDLLDLSNDQMVRLSRPLGKLTRDADASVDNGEASVEEVMAWMEAWATHRRLIATLEAAKGQVEALAAEQAKAKKARKVTKKRAPTKATTKKRPTGRTSKGGR